ncbi:hypothetical protein [Mycobacterium xenopi]|uniref:Uncharacterized protein n=1 Tax=Mycobacterium xenopi TaxID=1789 RepID=A0AAD1H0M5_MYCXE|nr:hypothetical protein [Mycobacterium xenopi]EUA44538.1 hypothetical protein I552_4311 [Mycobacterium xenopi 3993]MDA3640302.1 hypothetical protein [Mycobacterium xenopi]MDA3658465.1 hypothetical protein [Mycobacterium xenopi]MDA3664902.1 hypothetical protein [Mycobacterium xenopi]SPX78479.1 Uncharacterised protein [Mycobacterium xenopi]
MADEVKLNPAALRAASGTIARHAGQVASAAGRVTGSTEMAGVAATGVHSAFSGFCGEFSQRLWAASAALVSVAGSFTAMEDTNSQALASIAPGQV